MAGDCGDVTLEGAYTELTSEACGLLAISLDEVIRTFEGWSLRVLDVSRLRQSQRILHDVGDRGRFPTEKEELIRTANALQDAHDFRYISACLPPERVHTIARDLQKALGGTVTRRHEDRTAYQFQSEFVVATAFAFGGAIPVFSDLEDRRKPEFYVRNGTRWYGVEVKRPSSWSKAHRAVRRARRQLASPGVDFGVVVVDVSDCIPDERRNLFAEGPSEDVFGAFQEIVAREGASLEDELWNDESKRYHAGGDSVAVLVSFARAFAWSTDGLWCPKLMGHMRVATFSSERGRTLRWHRTRWLACTLLKGMEAAGYQR